MIIDTIENLGKYVALNPLFADVVEFLKNHDLQSMEPGKYPIKDKDLFMNLQVAQQRTKDTAFLETHIEMIDIQIGRHMVRRRGRPEAPVAGRHVVRRRGRGEAPFAGRHVVRRRGAA